MGGIRAAGQRRAPREGTHTATAAKATTDDYERRWTNTWNIDVRDTFKAIQSLRSGSVAHGDVSVLTRMIENHRNFFGCKVFYSETLSS